jgi:hypothetical protein
VILLRDAEEVDDDQRREGLAVLAERLELALVDELVDLPVGEPLHERLVLAHAPRREQPHDEPSVVLMRRRVLGHHVLAQRQLAAVLRDELVDVVTLRRDREPREGSRDGVARREGLPVPEHFRRLVVPGDRDHTVVGQVHHGALLL